MNPTFHDEAELWAAAAATDGLSAAELEAWRNHLQGCPACQKLHQEKLTMADLIKQTLETDREYDSHSPDAGFEQRIISRLDQAAMGKGNRWYEHLLFHPTLAMAAACLVAMAMAAGWLLHRGAPSKLAAPMAVVGGQPTAANLKTNPNRIGEIPVGTSPQDQQSGTAATTANAAPSPDGPNSVTVKNQPPPAPGKSLSIGNEVRTDTLAPTNDEGQFSLTNPNTTYPFGPGTEQKIATIATATHPAIIQGVPTITATDANPGHHHRHRRPHHHRRHHHHRHHHPAAPAITVTIPFPFS